MTPFDLRPYVVDAAFNAMHLQKRAYDLLGLPVISTGRPFSFYRQVFFDNRGEADVLADLRGKTVIDVGCGLTPFVSDSFFQTGNANAAIVYGVDPKLDGQFKFGALDRLKVRMTGGRGEFNPEAPFAERRLGVHADQIPLADGTVDLIVSSWLFSVWLRDEAILAKVFTEFFRLLKSGGQVKLYPQQLYRSESIASPALKQALACFDSSQTFRPSFIAWQGMPAYVTVLTKT